SSETVLHGLEERRFVLLVITFACAGAVVLGWFDVVALQSLYGGLFIDFYGWVTILTSLGLGRKLLNKNNRFTTYMARSSYSVYILHQTWIVVAAFYVFQMTESTPLRIVLILSTSVAATFVSYEIVRRTGPTRFLFGIKDNQPHAAEGSGSTGSAAVK
ncbi:MAG: hypothetical protein FWD11_11110, partial [Micrococcales bacterium]|nr:hypothetical protein [Micrococcales bacterium]